MRRSLRKPHPYRVATVVLGSRCVSHYRQSGQARAPRRPQHTDRGDRVVDHRPLGSRHPSRLPHDGAVAVARMAHRVVRRSWRTSYCGGESGDGRCVAHRTPVSACCHARIECHGPSLAACERLGLANRATVSIDTSADMACQYLLALSPRERLRKAGGSLDISGLPDDL